MHISKYDYIPCIVLLSLTLCKIILQAIEGRLRQPYEEGASSKIMFEDEEIRIDIAERYHGWQLLPLNALVVISTYCLCTTCDYIPLHVYIADKTKRC